MRTLIQSFMVVVGLALSACGPADEGDVRVADEGDSETDLGSTQEALVAGTTFPGGGVLSTQVSLPRKVCKWECTDPVDSNDIYHCKEVCKIVY
jgi:hypothetical protein